MTNLNFKKIKNEINSFIFENPLLIFLFFISSVYFLLQHVFYVGWDFSAYVINAKYFFAGGDYFEVYRAPLVSFLLGIFLFLGGFSEYIFILIVLSIFFISTVKLSGILYEKSFCKFNLDKKFFIFLFYFFNLNIFVLIFGVVEGTELLALSFFQFFLYKLIQGKISGHYLALAFLTRYNFILFLPFLFFNKDYKKIIRNFGVFFLVIFPWLLYNFLKWGNWFTSVIDSYYLNVFSRQHIIEVFNIFSLYSVMNFFLPFFLLGVFVFFNKLRKKEFYLCKYDFLFFGIFLFFIFDVSSIPFKVERYLFNFVLPISFFAVSGMIFLFEKFRRIKNLKKIISFIFLGFFVLIILALSNSNYENHFEDEMFFEASKSIEGLGFNECKIVSPHWVPVNYYSGNVYFLGEIDSALNNNETLLIFQNHATFDDKFSSEDLEKYVPLVKTKNYLIIANHGVNNETCLKRMKSDSPLTDEPCEILSSKFEGLKLNNFVKDFCYFINFN